jgi:hypothetical protein
VAHRGQQGDPAVLQRHAEAMMKASKPLSAEKLNGFQQ